MIKTTILFLTLCFSIYAQTSPLYQSDEVFSLTIEADFSGPFEKAKIGKKYSEFEGEREFVEFEGKLFYTDSSNEKELDVTMEVRGESSPRWAIWPKLHLSFENDKQRKKSIFHRAKRVKLGSHMRDEKGEISGHFQRRLLNELAPHRESLAYKLLLQLGLPAPLSRPALITYIDTSDESGGKVTRKAFLFEHKKQVAKRFKAELLKLDKSLRFGYASFPKENIEKLDRHTAILVNLFQTLIGQWDFKLPLAYDKRDRELDNAVKNTYVLIIGDKLFPVAEDFDLASIVTGEVHPRKHQKHFFPQEDQLFKNMAFQIGLFRKAIDSKNWNEAKSKLLQSESKLRSIAEQYPVDGKGREIALEHIHTFFKVLSEF